MITGAEVATRAKLYVDNNTTVPSGYSLRFARTCAGAPGAWPDARSAWKHAQHKHTGPWLFNEPPRGSFVFWSGSPHWHVAVSDGGGWVFAPDTDRRGYVDRLTIEEVRMTSGLVYEGWSEDINGVRVDLGQ